MESVIYLARVETVNSVKSLKITPFERKNIAREAQSQRAET